MNSRSRLAGPLRRSAAIAALVLASTFGQGVVAQAQAATVPGSPAAVPSASTQDIRDIRGPKPLASAWLIPLIALSTLVAAGGIGATWVWYKRRPNFFLQTPSEIALARLEYARGLMQPELGRDFSIEVSSTVREYIERRFRVKAAHLTTHEFLHDLLNSANSALAAKRPLLAEFMESCDLAKFGGWNLSMQDMDTMLETARRFVVESATDSVRGETAAGLASAPIRLTTVAATKTQAVTSRGTYDSLPST